MAIPRIGIEAVGLARAAVERGLYVGGYVGQGSKDAPRDFYELFNTDIQTFGFFTATEQTAQGPVLWRAVWIPQGAEVRETAETSTDGGKTWKPKFDIVFRKHR